MADTVVAPDAVGDMVAGMGATGVGAEGSIAGHGQPRGRLSGGDTGDRRGVGAK